MSALAWSLAVGLSFFFSACVKWRCTWGGRNVYLSILHWRALVSCCAVEIGFFLVFGFWGLSLHASVGR